jgi:hypothetical protein
VTEPLRRPATAAGDPSSRAPACRHDHPLGAWNALAGASVTSGRGTTRPACRVPDQVAAEVGGATRVPSGGPAGPVLAGGALCRLTRLIGRRSSAAGGAPRD